jgi:hypothetical protein
MLQTISIIFLTSTKLNDTQSSNGPQLSNDYVLLNLASKNMINKSKLVKLEIKL